MGPTVVMDGSGRSVEATNVDVINDIDGERGSFTVSGRVPYVCGDRVTIWYPGSKAPFDGVASTVHISKNETKVEWLSPLALRDLHGDWSGWTADEIIDYHARQLADRFPA